MTDSNDQSVKTDGNTKHLQQPSPAAKGGDSTNASEESFPSQPDWDGFQARRAKRRKRASPDHVNTTREEIAASYERYSSEHQHEQSIDDQQRKCREAASQNGHHLAAKFEYADDAVSGTKLHREGMDRMLLDAEAGRFQVLYFHSLSRLARESVITMPLLKRLVHSFRVRVISLTEGIDSSREGWELNASIMSVMHEQYLKELSANVRRGQEGVLLAGDSVGDYRFGYTSKPIPGSENRSKGRASKPRMAYAIDEEAATWVKRIFHWFAFWSVPFGSMRFIRKR